MYKANMAKLADAIASGAIRDYSLYKFKSCCSYIIILYSTDYKVVTNNKKNNWLQQSVAQLVACRHRESKVTGSNPVSLI